MRVIWEEKDIKPGRGAGKPGVTEKWMIGYIPDFAGNQYCIVSLEDGLICQLGTKHTVAEAMNNGDYLPEELLKE